MDKRLFILLPLMVGVVMAQQQRGPQDRTFEGQPAVVVANDKLRLTVFEQGAGMGELILAADPSNVSPLWNPVQLAAGTGSGGQFGGAFGHFVCLDGFGQPSDEERAAGLPQHGEVHLTHLQVTKDAAGNSVSLTGKLPIVQEVFTRKFRVVDGENVIYVDSQLENLMGFDRPVNWAEHATVAAPWLVPGKARIFLSGVRSQTRNYAAELAARGSAATAANAQGGGNPPATQRRLAPGVDFSWPMAPGLDGKPVDLSVIPGNPHFLDHAATLMDPSKKLEWAAVLNLDKGLIYGYMFRREDYPWMQHWGNFPNAERVVRGLEFGTQPYDLSRRIVLNAGPIFDTPTFRWLPAKSKIESHFIVYYAPVPAGFRQVDDVRLENGHLVFEDHGSGRQFTLAASGSL